tara:strand:+ start:152 stop:400 length:249 start_codon:yes stop_codon:yes gene_type:complete
MKNNHWIDLHYALRLQNTITVKTLKTIIKTIGIYIVYVSTLLILTSLLCSCASTHKKHYKAHKKTHNKVWDSYKTCSAYGNP